MKGLRTARRYGIDALIVVAAAEAAVEVALRHDAAGAPRSTAWFAVPAITLIVLPLLARRRFPFAAPASVWLISAALSFADGRLVPFTSSVFAAGMLAALLLGNLPDAAQARRGLAIVVGGAVIVTANGPRGISGDVLFVPLLFALVWIAGFALRARSEQAAAAERRASRAEWEREASARVAVAEERARIARELHDIVAHAVSVMVLQVGAVRHRLPAELAEDREALAGVERVGRASLGDMRRLLGAMRHDGDDAELTPQPGLGSLGALVRTVRDAGLPVRLRVDGEAVPLPSGIDLSAYRIVQEGLTNTLKHAGASQADVVVRYGPDELLLEVRDDGAAAPSQDGVGHGLVGIRERVKIYGGEMTAGAGEDGGFVLRTRLPLAGGTS